MEADRDGSETSVVGFAWGVGSRPVAEPAVATSERATAAGAAPAAEPSLPERPVAGAQAAVASAAASATAILAGEVRLTAAEMQC